MEVVRIDPISYSNPLITKDNFIHFEKLNRPIESFISKNCRLCNFLCCRELREPQGGYWLSMPTKDGSCVWRDYTRSWFLDHKEDDEKDDKEAAGGGGNVDEEEKGEDNYRKTWSNIRIVRYKCKPDIKLFEVKTTDCLKDYIYNVPGDPYYVSQQEIYLGHYQKILDFLETNKIPLDRSIPEDRSGRGIIVKFNKDDKTNFSITRSKSGSKKEIMASVNYWINNFNWEIEYYQKRINENITIDYDKLRSEGYNGIIFRKIKSHSDDDISSNISRLLYCWIPNTLVVWDYCFTDYEISFETSD